MPNRIWVDVEDLFQYSLFNSRLSGIQRIEFELCRSLALMPETRDRVGFVRHDAARNGFQAIPFSEVDALHARLTSARTQNSRAAAPVAAPPAGSAPATTIESGRVGRLARRAAYRIPLDVRSPLVNLAKAQRESVAAAGALATTLTRRLVARSGRGAARVERQGDGAAGDGLTVASFDATAGAGDVLLLLGASWFHPFYGALVAQACERWQLRMALLVYDVIPLLRPEWCQDNLVRRFAVWSRSLLPQADTLLTISQASARDLLRLAERDGLTLRAAPKPIPIGSGFTRPEGAGATPPARTDRLPAAGSYVLLVSTIEARKNHILLFRIWRRLLDELPAGEVPTLVFAGKVGWLVDDLMQQLRNAQHLGGKVLVLEDPQDGELELLYQGCRFTLFPSFYEGWGLPVTESFSFGRPCIASNATSLPEAGGTLARYFDPENGVEAYRVIRSAIENVDETEAWARRVAAEFHPVSWDESARAIVHALDQTRGRLAGKGPAPVRNETEAASALRIRA